MLKVKIFTMNSGNPLHIDRLEQSINTFIETNDIEIVDIKYSTTCLNEKFIPSAMLFYRESK